MLKATALSAGFGLLFVLLAAGCGGGGSTASMTLAQVHPPEGLLAGGTEVTLFGTRFGEHVDAVLFGDREATNLHYVNNTTVRCVTPPGDLGPCSVWIMVDGTRAGLPYAFTYKAPPTPTLTAVTPDEGPPGVPTGITLTGSGFIHAPVTVTIDGMPCPNVTVLSDSSLTCSVPASRSGQNLTVTVTTAGGSASLPNAFSYLVYPYRGTYFFVEFSGLTIDNEPGQQPTRIPAARASWGTLLTDGGGIHTGGEVWTNDQGAISGPTAPPSMPHQVEEDRRFTWGSSTNPDLVGRITADGSLGILGTVKRGVQPAVMIVGRVEEGPYDEGSLSGVYHVGAVFGDDTFRGALWGTTEFDGGGGAASEIGYNGEGATLGPFFGSDTYTISPEGRVTYALPNFALNFEGQILQGGELVILAGGNASQEFPTVVVLVKATSGAALSALSGNYAFAAMLKGNPGWDVNTGTAESQGDGNCTVLDLLGHDGSVTWTDWPESPYDFTYTVSTVDGRLEAYVDGTVTGGGGMLTQGATMLGGDFAFFAGSRTFGERPMLWFLLR
jgi:IPT/TIG domain